MKKFEDCTYLSQVRRCRKLAKAVLRNYSFKVERLDFVNHGENTTFKVFTKKRNYLLRIHRENYHSPKAILEELKWLNYLSEKSEVNVQSPIKTKDGKLCFLTQDEEVGHRFIDLLTWEDGVIKNKKSQQDFNSIGQLLGNLQMKPIKSKHRHYWDADGLLGKKATFGALSLIKDDYKKAYQILEPCRKEVYSAIKTYQRKYPNKLSLIHADLHFGNMIWNKEGITPIDFDDCGYGFHMYDLAVNLCNSSNFFKRIGKKEASRLKYSLLEGYAKKMNLTEDDISLIPHLIRAREILMISWLYLRQDNPQLKEHMIKHLPSRVKRIKKNKEYSL